MGMHWLSSLTQISFLGSCIQMLHCCSLLQVSKLLRTNNSKLKLVTLAPHYVNSLQICKWIIFGWDRNLSFILGTSLSPSSPHPIHSKFCQFYLLMFLYPSFFIFTIMLLSCHHDHYAWLMSSFLSVLPAFIWLLANRLSMSSHLVWWQNRSFELNLLRDKGNRRM